MATEWFQLREDLLGTEEARAEYERARRAYEHGMRVRDLREAAGLTQQELGELVGSTQQAVALMEAGVRQVPS